MSKNNFWEGYETRPIPQNQNKIEKLRSTPVQDSNFWDGYETRPIPQQNNIPQSQQEDEGYLATIGKSAITGASRILDLPQTVGVLAEKGSRAYAKAAGKTLSGKKSELDQSVGNSLSTYGNNPEILSQIKPASQRVRDFVGGEGNLDARPVGTGQRLISEAVDVGTSLATNPLGFIGNAGKIGSTTFNLAKTGAAIGGTSGVLKEIGVDPLAADIGATLAVPLGGSAIRKTIGLSPNKLNKQVYEAAKELNIELPAASVSRSKALDLAEDFVGKVPVAGDILHNKYNVVGRKITEELDKVYDKIIPQAELKNVDDKISQLYKKAEKTLPQNASIAPTNLTKQINEIETKIGKGYYTSGDQKEVLGIIDTIKQNRIAEGEIASIEKLRQTKAALNDQITWDKSEGYKNLLKGIQRSINEDIKAYGKSSPEAKAWYEFYSEADKLFGKVKKREELEFLLSGKATNQATDTLSHNTLSKIIHTKKTRNEIKRLLGKGSDETLNKIDKIGSIAKAISIKNKNVPNPSGTATVAGVAGIITGLIYDPIKTVAAIGFTGLTTNLITNQKYLDNAYKALVLKDKGALIRFESQIKTITGSSVVDLSKQLDRQQNRPVLTKEERKKKDELRKQESDKNVEIFRKQTKEIEREMTQ